MARQDTARVVGFSVIDAGPISSVHVPYREGLTVLYGANGAGKTYALDGIRATLTGIRPTKGRSVVHINVEDDPNPIDRDPEDEFLDAYEGLTFSDSIGFEVARYVDPLVPPRLSGDMFTVRDEMDRHEVLVGERSALFVDPETGEYVPPPFSQVLEAALAHAASGPHGLPEPTMAQERLAMQIATGQTVSLEPVGDTHPEWKIYVSALQDENAPELSREIDNARRIGALSRDWSSATPIEKARVFVAAWRGREIEDDDRLNLFVDAISREDLLRADTQYRTAEGVSDLLGSISDSLEFDEGEPSISRALSQTDVQVRLGLMASLDEFARFAPNGVHRAFDPAVTPAEIPIPLFHCGTAEHLDLPFVAGLPRSAPTERIEREIRSRLEHSAAIREIDSPSKTAALFDRFHNDELLRIEAEIGWLPHEIAKLANDFLEAILPDAPVLQVRATPVEDWLAGTWFAWQALDRESLQWVPLDDLSEAQQRWVTIALDFASTASDDQEGVIIIDEPERGLHRSAVSKIATNLPSLASNTHNPAIVATHAPELLGAADAQLLHIQRSDVHDGKSIAIPMAPWARSDLASMAADLSVKPTDLLQLVRTFVIVEGDHDRIVIESILESTLQEHLAVVVPIRGTHRLSTLLDAELLLRYTTARIVVVLDHITDPAALANAWIAARDLAASNPKAALSTFGSAIRERERDGAKTGEDRSAADFAFKTLRSAATTQYPSRIDLFGFTRPGIEKYLPISSFTDDASASWDALDDEYLRDRSIGNLNEKAWLKSQHGIEINNSTIEEAVGSLDSGQISDEFRHLAEVIARHP